MGKSNQSMWDHEILYADLPSEDGELLIRTLREKPKIQTWRAVET
jgi:hypothetical protein